MREEEKRNTKIAVIPARGGSTRLKDKNIYPLSGKPLIDYTVESIIESGCFDTIMVSTDSDRIAEVVSKYDVDIHIRDPRYATNRITVLEAMLAMMQEIPKHDIFSYFLPTCPLRSPADIKQGIDLLKEEVDSVVSVVEYSEPIQLALIVQANAAIPVFDNLTAGLTNSRYINKYYRPNGAFYISWWDKLIKNRNFFVNNVKAHIMPKKRSIDINDHVDITVAEIILNKMNNMR